MNRIRMCVVDAKPEWARSESRDERRPRRRSHVTVVAASLAASLMCSVACGDSEQASQPAETNTPSQEDSEEPRVGFEILQVRSPTETLVWINTDITQEDFDSIDLPQGWFKNQPREGEADSGSFARSPNASADGDFRREMHFGYEWLHNATIVEANVPVDTEGLLRLNRVAKFHTISFSAGRTLSVLVSPQGESYVRVSRDAGRSTDMPTIPSDWQLGEQVISESLTIELPNPTDNIRADNEDSWQGPVPAM